MRHKKSFNHLGRKKGHRTAMLANMASSLIKHKRITTTVAKAKALRSYVEPLITKSKSDETHSRRVVFSYLKDKEATTELFKEVSPKVADRPGGYTRIIKLPTRLGDSADMAMIELVDFNELLVKESKPKKARRSRRSGSAKKTEVAAPATEAKVEEPKAEVAEEVVEAPAAEEAPVAEAEAPAAEEAPKEEEGGEEDKKEA
ncbi:MAG: 50S ribosomal protein L17 [Flavobacteriales bacterium]|nr:50S ribosomal protein L17 [Flavobacteriales bacterium]